VACGKEVPKINRTYLILGLTSILKEELEFLVGQYILRLGGIK
jgi:hypothetical protein